jgi:hypothetical protein
VRVGHLVIELAAALVKRVKLGLVLRQRPVAAGAPLPRRLGIDLEDDRKGAVSEDVPDRRGLDRPAAEGNHGRLREMKCSNRLALLLEAEVVLPGLLKELGDRLPQSLLELPVEIDERPAETIGDLRSKRRLPRAHEADEREVSV